MKRRKFRVVGSENAEDIFDDLDALRRAQSTGAPLRRQRLKETFARIPHDRARHELKYIGAPAWRLLIEIDRLILKSRGKNPVRLTNYYLRTVGVTNHSKTRGLRQLEDAGVIRIALSGRGRAPMITHLWFPIQD
jgi:hypothetical protein